jgi:hypothetical protein
MNGFAAGQAADWLEVVLPRLPSCLAGDRAVERLYTLARRLPWLPGDGPIVLETRLTPAGNREQPVDLSLQVTTPAQAAALAAAAEEAAGTAAWQRFLHAWAIRPEWRARIPSLWLEFDLDRPPAASPVPVVCAQLTAGVEAAWVAGTLLPAMSGAKPEAAQRRLLESCWREVPAPGRPLYVFALLPRRTGAVRVEIAGGLELPALAAFLRRLRAPAAAARVAGLEALLDGADRLHLSCDLGDSLAPRIGVEVSFPRQPRRDPRWARLFERLVAAGLCSPAARDAALAWPGKDSLWTAPARWPAARGAAAVRCVRALSHVKLVCERRRPARAKLYLLVACQVPAGSRAARRPDQRSGWGGRGPSAPPAALSSQVSAPRVASCSARSR